VRTWDIEGQSSPQVRRGLAFVFGLFASFVGEAALEALRDYWQGYQPRDRLFPGAEPGRHLSLRSIQAVFGRAREAAPTRQFGSGLI